MSVNFIHGIKVAQTFGGEIDLYCNKQRIFKSNSSFLQEDFSKCFQNTKVSTSGCRARCEAQEQLECLNVN